MILKNLEQQKACYGLLLKQLQKQKKAILDRDDEGLMTAIKTKNEQIQTLHRLERDLNQLTGKLNAEEKEITGRRTETLRQEIVQALERLIAEEEDCQQALSQEKDNLQAQMLEFKRKKKLFKGYQDPSSSKGGGFSGNV